MSRGRTRRSGRRKRPQVPKVSIIHPNDPRTMSPYQAFKPSDKRQDKYNTVLWSSPFDRLSKKASSLGAALYSSDWVTFPRAVSSLQDDRITARPCSRSDQCPMTPSMSFIDASFIPLFHGYVLRSDVCAVENNLQVLLLRGTPFGLPVFRITPGCSRFGQRFNCPPGSLV